MFRASLGNKSSASYIRSRTVAVIVTGPLGVKRHTKLIYTCLKAFAAPSANVSAIKQEKKFCGLKIRLQSDSGRKRMKQDA